jgi:hypothetical protein
VLTIINLEKLNHDINSGFFSIKSTKLFIYLFIYFQLTLVEFEFKTINKFVLYGNILKYNNQMQIMPNHMNMSLQKSTTLSSPLNPNRQIITKLINNPLS